MQYFDELDNIDKILEAHKNMVDDMNKYNQFDKQIEVDETLKEKLSNPEVVETRLIAQELMKKRELQNKIFDNLKQKYSEFNPSIHSSIIKNMFLISNTEEAIDYNEKLFKNFLKDPNKYLYDGIKKVLVVRAKDLYPLDENPLINAKFYRDHYEMIENASMLVDIIKNNNNITKELKDLLPSMNSFIKLVEYPKYSTIKYECANNIAIPKLSPNQATSLIENDYLQNKNDKDFSKLIELQTDDKNMSPRKYFHYLNRIMIKSKKSYNIFKKTDEFITKFVAYSKEEGHENESVDMNRITFHKSGDQVGIKTVYGTMSQIGIECITNDFKEKYMTEWGNTFQTLRHSSKDFDINRISNELKGGFFERLRKTTSNEYKEMINALREFNDPKSPNYLNYSNLKNKAKEYIAHKESQGYGTTKNYSGTSKKRKDLADTILSIEFKQNEIVSDVKAMYLKSIPIPQNEIVKKQVFNSNDIVEYLKDKKQNLENVNNEETEKENLEELDDDSPNLNINTIIENNS